MTGFNTILSILRSKSMQAKCINDKKAFKQNVIHLTCVDIAPNIVAHRNKNYQMERNP